MKDIVGYWITIITIMLEKSKTELTKKELEFFTKGCNVHIMSLELLKLGIISEMGLYSFVLFLRARIEEVTQHLGCEINDDIRSMLLSDKSKSENTINKIESIIS